MKKKTHIKELYKNPRVHKLNPRKIQKHPQYQRIFLNTLILNRIHTKEKHLKKKIQPLGFDGGRECGYFRVNFKSSKHLIIPLNIFKPSPLVFS